MKITVTERKFCAYYHFVHWTDISLGINIDIRTPAIEIHLPFGFIRIGWRGKWNYEDYSGFKSQTFGWDEGELQLGRFNK